MNSLNILSGLTSTPPATPPRSRTSSLVNAEDHGNTLATYDFASIDEKLSGATKEEDEGVKQEQEPEADEKAPLLGDSRGESFVSLPGEHRTSWTIHRRLKDAIVRGLNVVITAITAPGRYVLASFFDAEGHFSAVMPLRNLRAWLGRRRRKSSARAIGMASAPDERYRVKRERTTSEQRSPSADSVASASSFGTTDGETDTDSKNGGPAKYTRSRTAQRSEDGVEPKRKTIKLKQNDEVLKKRRSPASASNKARRPGPSSEDVRAVANYLKSPSSPGSTRLTRYPRTPQPPRPLVPRRQPSYSTPTFSISAPKKTLVIDLDETLIHSMAKGGRMSTGHMVEVQLNAPISQPQPTLYGETPARPPVLGPGVPILYYVHERPGCHDFLRKMAKWYNLVVFTASVQEYADPVVDWLERERKYFSGRFYRQHCTYRGGAYVKDLAQVEPDLSKVMILDNSPMSYVFHEDNAIPIEGWISDPTDNDLLHLIPFLEGLQYVTDVRALLALRQGQAQQA